MNKYYEDVKSSINTVLYNLDPLGTCCKENDNFDEYTFEAFQIAGWYIRGIKDTATLKETIKAVFEYAFWDNCLTEQQLEEITNEISKSAGVHQRP